MRNFSLLSVGVAVLACLFASADAQDKQPPAKDPKAVVISYDPGAGGFIRKGEAPYLKIQADGQVTVTGLHDGAKAQAKLAPKELADLLKFIVVEQKFFDLTEKKMNDAIKVAAANGPFIAIGGAGTSKIVVEADGRKHEVSFRAASAYASAYPKVEVVPQFVAIEKKLSDYAAAVKGK